jgi:hypothetical protein
MRHLYQTLLHARRKWPPLADRQFTRARLEEGNAVLVLERGESSRLTAVANLTAEARPITATRPGGDMLLSTAERRFGGSRENRLVNELLPYELVVYGDKRWLETDA